MKKMSEKIEETEVKMDYMDILFKSVKDQLGCEDEEELQNTLIDVCRYGANMGVPGFIYYEDTIKFYEDNEEEIWDLLGDQYAQMGEYDNIIDFITSFQGVKNVENLTHFKNLLTWYALEEVARFKTDF